MRQFRYVTNRTLVNKAGQQAGKIRIMVKIDADQAEGDYRCPECQHEGKISQVFKRPFSIHCTGCNLLIRLPRLKGKAK